MDVSSVATMSTMTELLSSLSTNSGSSTLPASSTSLTGVVFTPSQELLNLRSSESLGLVSEMTEVDGTGSGSTSSASGDAPMTSLPAMVAYQLFDSAGAAMPAPGLEQGGPSTAVLAHRW